MHWIWIFEITNSRIFFFYFLKKKINLSPLESLFYAIGWIVGIFRHLTIGSINKIVCERISSQVKIKCSLVGVHTLLIKKQPFTFHLIIFFNHTNHRFEGRNLIVAHKMPFRMHTIELYYGNCTTTKEQLYKLKQRIALFELDLWKSVRFYSKVHTLTVSTWH